MQESQLRKALNEIGKFVENEAADRAPFLEGHLTGSIVHENYPEEKAVVVKVPLNAPAQAYATPMHENTYEPSVKSVEKQGKTGKEVGAKYITRAIDDNRNKIIDIAVKTLKL